MSENYAQISSTGSPEKDPHEPVVWVNPIPMECGIISLGSERTVQRFTLSVSCRHYKTKQ